MTFKERLNEGYGAIARMNIAAPVRWMRSTFELGDHNRRLSSMEGLRGLAILLVFVCHYNDIIGVRLALPASLADLSRVLGTAGGFGVDLFFLLSGFLIYRTTLRPHLNVGSFWMRRAERIYPTFIVVFACFLALGAAHLGPLRLPAGITHGSEAILANVLFLPGMFDMPAVISAAWSLSYECFFYLALPLVVIALRIGRWPRAARLGFFFALCGAYEALCLLAPAIFPHFANFEGSHVRLIMFVCGMIVYELLESPRFLTFFRPRMEAIAVGVATLCGIALLAIVSTHRDGASTDGAWSAHAAAIQVIPTFIGFACLGLVVLRDDGALAHLFRATWLRWTGNISYSFYLVHSIPMHFASIVIAKAALHVTPAVAYLVALPFTLVFTYAVSALLFATIEKPLSLRPRRAAAAPRPELQIA